MKKKLYKIRNKTTGKFVTAGYTGRSSWLVYPSAVIECNSLDFEPKDNFEVVVYEYVATHTLPLK